MTPYDTMNERPFARVVDDLLSEREWSRRELARQSGLSATTIVHFLHGVLPPTIGAMKRVATALQIRPETFAEYRLDRRREELNWRTQGLGRALRAAAAGARPMSSSTSRPAARR